MAEYIEREALIAEIEENINTYWNEGSGGYYLAEDALNYSIKTAPNANFMAEWILYRPRVRGRNATYKCSNCGKLCSSYYNDVGEWKCCPHCMTPITRTPKERGGEK